MSFYQILVKHDFIIIDYKIIYFLVPSNPIMKNYFINTSYSLAMNCNQF